jgi:hypothetical protein
MIVAVRTPSSINRKRGDSTTSTFTAFSAQRHTLIFSRTNGGAPVAEYSTGYSTNVSGQPFSTFFLARELRYAAGVRKMRYGENCGLSERFLIYGVYLDVLREKYPTTGILLYTIWPSSFPRLYRTSLEERNALSRVLSYLYISLFQELTIVWDLCSHSAFSQDTSIFLLGEISSLSSS